MSNSQTDSTPTEERCHAFKWPDKGLGGCGEMVRGYRCELDIDHPSHHAPEDSTPLPAEPQCTCSHGKEHHYFGDTISKGTMCLACECMRYETVSELPAEVREQVERLLSAYGPVVKGMVDAMEVLIDVARDGCAHEWAHPQWSGPKISEQCSLCRQTRWRVPK